jgi:putative effector of murein hydrolase
VIVFGITFVAYVAMIVLPRQSQNWFVIPFLMACVLYTHVNSMMYDDDNYPMDVSTFTMLQVCRFWALSFAYRDGDSSSKRKLSDY